MNSVGLDVVNREEVDSAARRARDQIRSGPQPLPTSGLAPGYQQANLVVLPHDLALPFVQFCLANAQACPLIDVTSRGSGRTWTAPDADLRTDVPLYRIYSRDDPNRFTETRLVGDAWGDDMVAFLLGCSFTLEHALAAAGLPIRHWEQAGANCPMFTTDIPCRTVEPFSGPLVVTMRPMPESRLSDVYQISSRFPNAHGAPVHVGDPAELGIASLARVDFGNPVEIRDGEVPVYWACGVTSQLAVLNANPEIAITHAPGHMFITDLPIDR